MSSIFTFSRSGLLGLALLAAGAVAHAYTEQEMTTDVHNDSVSQAEWAGTLIPSSSLSIAGSRESGVYGGSSADFYAFDVSQPMWVSVSITTPLASAQPVIGLFHGPVGSAGLLASAQDDNSTTSTTTSFAYQITNAGTYYAAVTGFCPKGCGFDGGGNAGWNYDLTLRNFEAVPPPVPEPESLALMLAGLGVVGLAARRRRTR